MYVLHDPKTGEILGTQTFPDPSSFKDDPEIQDQKGNKIAGKTAAQKWADYLSETPLIEVPDSTDVKGKKVDIKTKKLVAA